MKDLPTLAEINEITDSIQNLSIGSVTSLYDPRIKDKKDDSQVIWNSVSVELARKGLIEGYQLRQNPFLKTLKDVQLRKANLPFQMDEDEQWVFEQCMFDKIMFGNNFISLKDAQYGWQRIKLRKYQEDLIYNYTHNRWNIVLFPRQAGKTTTTVIDIVHFCTFNVDKDCVVIAQSEKVVNEILTKIKEAFASLPFFMQPGFIRFTKNGFALDNGCRLSIGVASESVVQGFSLDYVLIDEFAYISNTRVKKFWNNLYPTLANNPESKLVITSTPNGRNLFWELWVAAVNGKNRFKTNRIYWYDVPGRDEKFKEDTIANVGLESWEMSYECSFDTQLKSIFHSRIQKILRDDQKQAEPKTLNEPETGDWSIHNHYLGELFDIEFINPEKLTFNIKEDYFFFGIDLGEGLSQDSTTIKIRKLHWNSELKRIDFKTCGVFINNEIAVEDFAELTLNLFNHFDQNKIRVIVDLTNYGNEYFAHIDKLKLYDSRYYGLDNIIFAKFESNTKKDYERGIRWNQQNKKLAVRSFTGLVNSLIFNESHFITVEEYLNFGKNLNGSYSAQYGHDDLIMSDISIAHFVKSNNLFANEFIKNAEFDFRRIHNDLNEEQLKEEAKIQKLQSSIHEWKGMYQRNSELEEQYNNTNNIRKNINMDNVRGSLFYEKNNPTVIKNDGLIDNNTKRYNTNGVRRRGRGSRNDDSDYFN